MILSIGVIVYNSKTWHGHATCYLKRYILHEVFEHLIEPSNRKNCESFLRFFTFLVEFCCLDWLERP